MHGSSAMLDVQQSQQRTPLWLDCDPGHDDACALLLAIHHPSLELLGVSTVGGNAPGANTCANAAQLLVALGAPESVELWRGSDLPLLKPARSGDVAIHGEGGLGGVVGLPPLSDPAVQRRFTGPRSSVCILETSLIPPHEPAAVVIRLAELIGARIREGKPKLHIVITGPCTNIALFCKMYPHLLAGVEQIVLMGGSAGRAGNRGPLAEFNILCDPEAATIVFDADIKVVMAGLNVTHSAIFTQHLHARLLNGPSSAPTSGPSPIRTLLSSILTFFSHTYASEFGFLLGPPVHDSLAVMYLIDPKLFWTYEPAVTAIYGQKHSNASSKSRMPTEQAVSEIVPNGDVDDGHTSGLARSVDGDRPLVPPQRYQVRVECSSGSLAEGATVVDWWNNWGLEHDGWGRGGKNVEVLEEVDLEKMWATFMEVVDRAEGILHPDH
ncbi:hypothetical protein A4X13_0g1381 [Tilletia indica]|uniref:Inosine/uridine-preferring nucleoside hydrolase domain-containing protein n=1 Tax=Tilletia indica TaxID=43049 RepID=A0A177TVP8_9BASI|nr:hypothetical protein A4X13_0g1381 [Tilletia indica]